MDITIGQELSKEDWLTVRDNLQVAFIAIADMLEQKNHEGQGKKDKKEFLEHAQMAYIAMTYVAEFATDKCRFIPI